jgi:hypothetical protein
MSIRSHTRMKLHVRNCDASSSFPHVFSGNPGGIRTGPPIKAFGGDGCEAVSLVFACSVISTQGTKGTKDHNDYD